MIFRPYSSDSGPTTKGPMPNPNTYRLILRMVTSWEVCKSFARPVSVNAAYGTEEPNEGNVSRPMMLDVKFNERTTEDANVAHREDKLMVRTASHFLHNARPFGSSSGSSWTRYGSDSSSSSISFLGTGALFSTSRLLLERVAVSEREPIVR